MTAVSIFDRVARLERDVAEIRREAAGQIADIARLLEVVGGCRRELSRLSDIIEELRAAGLVISSAAGAGPVAPQREKSAVGMRIIALRFCEVNGIDLFDLRGPARHEPLVHVRQDAMRAMADAGFSTTQIGRFLGGRDHSTVIWGINQSRERATAAAERVA